MSQIYLKNAYIITMNPTRDVYQKASILIENDIIKEIGQIEEIKLNPKAEILDVTGKIIMPGLINTHVHTSQQLARGIADDVDLLVWLIERIWPYESSLNYEDSLISSLACCVELIKTGVTTFLEAGGQFVDAMVEAVDKCGLRACLTASIMDCGEGLPEKWRKSHKEYIQFQEDLFQKYNDTSEGRIKIWFGLRTIFNNSDELIVETKQLADKYRTGIHMHVAEVCEEIDFVKKKTGHKGTIDHLNHLGVLGPNLLAVHSVWLTEEEIDLIKKNEVKVSHCPAAAMKVTLGFSKVKEMIDKKICVSIGTDGAPSNNKMDLFRDLYLAALIHKGRTLNPKALISEEILEMVTINAAKCSLMEDSIGSLEVNKKADLIILNPDFIGSLPCYNIINNIVYSMSSENVEATMCNGKWLIKNRKVLILDEEELIGKVKKMAMKIKDKIKVNDSKFNIIPNE